jgi:hypothetical protein
MFLQIILSGILMDIDKEAQSLKDETKALKRHNFKLTHSKLDKFAFELKGLHEKGCTGAEIQRWLKKQRVTACHSTIQRWLRKNEILK